jgi:hypothetical protein
MNHSKLGSVNAAWPTTIYRGSVAVGSCIDTPNAVAYAFKVLDADRAKGPLGETTRAKMSAERVAAGGWLATDEDAQLRRYASA